MGSEMCIRDSSIVLVTVDLKLGFSTFRDFTQAFNGKEARDEISTELLNRYCITSYPTVELNIFHYGQLTIYALLLFVGLAGQLNYVL